MPEENPITESGLAKRAGPSVTTLTGPRNSSFFAGRLRWVICALLFFGVTKNYMDRQVLGVLKGTLQRDLGWNDIDYGNLVFAFQAAYAMGIIFVGRLIDRLGTRIGYAVVMVFWSLASMGHALANSLAGFMIARCALGFGEAGVFPASIKCVAEWFPKKERALATGIFNAGTNIGAIITPLVVPWIVVHWGWRWAFIGTGSLGFAWLILWLLLYRKPREHPLCTDREREYIESDAESVNGKIKWAQLLPHKQTWAFAAGKFMTDPIWWFYLFWIPDYLQREHGLHLMQIGLPILVIYVISDAGSIAGGWLSSRLIRRGLSVNASREMRDARLRAERLADCRGLPDFRAVACHAGDWSSRRGPSRLFRKFVYAGIGPFPVARRRVRGGNWRHGRSDWRHVDRRNRGSRPAVDRQLCGSLFHGSVGLLGRFVFHSTVEPSAGTCGYRSVVNQ